MEGSRFFTGLLDVEGICPPIWGDILSVNGGTLDWGIDIMGDLTLIDYIIH